MNKNIATTPSLSFKEALCKAWSNLTNLKGRSRRSELVHARLLHRLTDRVRNS